MTHSRYALASHVAGSETAQAAIAVFDKAVAAHGVPQRLLSDNGVALNPSRRGVVGQLVAHVAALGVEAITGKPYKPTTQGKNEHFHQTLFRYLDKQPLVETLAELQAQVDAFDDLYNNRRPHQGLPGRLTPATAWQATAKTDAPRPRLDRPAYARPAPRLRPAPPTPALIADLPADTTLKTLSNTGTFMLDSVHYRVGGQHGFHHVLIVIEGDQIGNTIIVTDLDGEILIVHTRPEPGIKYVGNARPPGGPGSRPKPDDNPEASPMS